MNFEFTKGLTTDTNLAETGGDGSDILDSVGNLNLKLAQDDDDPVIDNQIPANTATGVAVNSNISFRLYDAKSGINSSQTSARMKKFGGSWYAQTVSHSSSLTTNQNRYYQYSGSVSPNSNIKTNNGYYLYNTVYTIEVTAVDLASAPHSTISEWSFTTEDDVHAPYVTNFSPTDGSSGVAVDSNISFRVKDYKSNGGVIPGLGVDTDSIAIIVSSTSQGAIAYDCNSPNVTCNDSNQNDVIVSLNPSDNFAENESVMVYVGASDLHAPGNEMSTSTYTFTTADTVPPTVSNFIPVVNSTGNSTSTNISFHLIDDGSGVAIETLSVMVNNNSYTALSPELAIEGDSSDSRQIAVSSIDTVRKQITANISWKLNEQRNGLVSLSTMLSNWQASAAGDWLNVFQEAFLDLAGNNDAVKIQTQGDYVYAIRNVGSPNFFIISIAGQSAPAISGSLTLSGNPTNIFVSGDYAYVSNSGNSEELQIVSINDPNNPLLSGTYNAPGNANANGVFAINSSVYLVRSNSSDNEFLIVNAVNPGQPAYVSSLDLGQSANEIVVSGNFALISNTHNSQELQSVNISNPSVPVLAGALNLSGNDDGGALAFSGSVLLMARGSSLLTINITNPSAPSLLGTYAGSGTINDIALNFANSGAYAFLATSANAAELVILDISSSANPVQLSFINKTGNDDLLGICYNENLDRAIGSGASNAEEITIFAPQ